MSQITVDEAEAIEFMYEQSWTDGLPVVPPTSARVQAMLAAAGLSEDTILGSVPSRRKTVSANIAASNAVMAGCRPEYFPLVVTAIEAVFDPAFNVNTVATSTGGAAICIIVSGPEASRIGMNAEHNLLGSGNRANATIGRAVRLTVANGLGAKTGKLDASSIGHPGKITLCFAEKDPDAPWPALRLEHGYRPEDSTVTIMATEGPRQIAQQLSESPEDVLLAFTGAMKQPSQFITGKRGQCVVILGHEHAQSLRKAGWSKSQARAFLAEHSRISPAELAAGGIHVESGAQHDMSIGADGRIATFADPADITLVTAGGAGAGWSAYLPAWAPKQHSLSITRRLRPVGEALPDCGPDGCALPGFEYPSKEGLS
ncbi:thiol-disulfide oxidoreductase domain protein [Luminiphilus syltensis NOR5-1B]|uniref:Thiol-disulfide oxidoreductase domain protein n=1 Tax=Luminiphilus syltensis NOR5-1B TaxID=565045 RepID=B8KXF1_9GAMM|nr:hypothetical protein [Luminiphilus syltensis]EED36242.1 thiol-disulfide oxidoreductase domain protein [Luminiphilus syltensis NOR5-1B]